MSIMELEHLKQIDEANKELARARLALAQIHEVIDTVYCWDMGRAMDDLERCDVEEIAKTLQEFFDIDTKPTEKETA